MVPECQAKNILPHSGMEKYEMKILERLKSLIWRDNSSYGGYASNEFFAIHDGKNIILDTLESGRMRAENSRLHSWWKSSPNAKIVRLELVEKDSEEKS